MDLPPFGSAGMKRNSLSILLILVMSFLFIFPYVNACCYDLMGTNDCASRGDSDGDTEDSPDDQIDQPGVNPPLMGSFLFLKGYFLDFLSGFPFSTLLILFSTSILRC